MTHGKLALGLCLILIVVFALSAAVFLVFHTWLGIWALAPAIAVAAIAGPLAGRRLVRSGLGTRETE